MSDSLFDPALDEIVPDLGWGRLAPGRLSVHGVPGEHVSMFREPHVAVLADELTRRSRRSGAATPASRPG